MNNGSEGIWECSDGLHIRVEGLRKCSRKVCRYMYLYRHTARHYESKERPGKLCLLRLGLHHLQSCHVSVASPTVEQQTWTVERDKALVMLVQLVRSLGFILVLGIGTEVWTNRAKIMQRFIELRVV